MSNSTPQMKFEVSYRNKGGDMTTKRTEAVGTDNRTVRERFEAQGYEVMSVVYKGPAR